MAKSSAGGKGAVRSAQSTAKSSSLAKQTLGAASAQPKPQKLSNFQMPLDLIERSKEWGYKTFDSLRRKLNKELAKHPEFVGSRHGTKRNIKEMRSGRNPYAPTGQAKGKQTKMHYDHHVERQQIKAVYKKSPTKVAQAATNVSNLTMRSPTSHGQKLSYRFHKAAGTPVEGHSRFMTPSPVSKPKTPAVQKAPAAVSKSPKSPMSPFRKH